MNLHINGAIGREVPECGSGPCGAAAAATLDPVLLQNPYRRCSIYGAALVAAEVFDSDFCVHGPQGCTSAVKEAFAVQGREYDYHNSGMTQSEVIFGGERCLVNALTDAFYPYEKAGPKFMVTSCSSEIIGDNVDAIAARVNPGLPLVKVTSGGIKGDQYFGLDQALLGLVSKFAASPLERQPNLVNLVGAIGLNRGWRADVAELRRLLEALGLAVNAVACDSTIAHFQRCAGAALTILLTPDVGWSAAQFLEKRFGIPYLISPLFYPLGLRGTEIWLSGIARALSVADEKVVAFVDAEELRARDALKIGLSQVVYSEKVTRLRRLPTAIVAEGPAAISWARFLAEELDALPVYLGMRTGVDRAEVLAALAQVSSELALSPRVEFDPSCHDVERSLRETGAELVLGSSVELDIARRLGLEALLIANPNTHRVNIAPPPFLGYVGLLHATEAVLNSV